MAEYCVACNAELKREKYRLRGKFGKPTQLGRVVKDLVEQDLCDIATIVVCSKCRYSLLTTNTAGGVLPTFPNLSKMKLAQKGNTWWTRD